MRVGLFEVERHPVVPGLQPQRQPVAVARLVQHACLGVEEIDDLFLASGHSAATTPGSMLTVMNWLGHEAEQFGDSTGELSI